MFQSAVGDQTNTALDPSNNSRTTRLQQEEKEGLILVFQSCFKHLLMTFFFVIVHKEYIISDAKNERKSELRSCVKVEVAVLGSLSLTRSLWM